MGKKLRNKYSLKEFKILKKYYGKKSNKVLAKLLNKHIGSIRVNALKLGLKSKVAYYTQQDIFYIKKYYGKRTVEYIQKFVKHSRGSIEDKARKLGLESKLHLTCAIGRPCSRKLKKYLSKINSGKNSVLFGKTLPRWHKKAISVASKKLWKKNRKQIILAIRKSKQSKKYLKKISWLSRGKNNGMYGKHHSKQSKEKISQANIKAHLKKDSGFRSPLFLKKRRILGKRLWKNPNYVKKVNKAIADSLKNLLPTFPERILLEMMKLSNIPFEYVGNRKEYIGGFNPDFIYKEHKKIIEVYGEYHHNFEDVKKRDLRRKRVYKQLGYKLLIIKSKPLIRHPHEAFLKVIDFYVS
jgi:very-short-patch-repair endonuclease